MQAIRSRSMRPARWRVAGLLLLAGSWPLMAAEGTTPAPQPVPVPTPAEVAPAAGNGAAPTPAPTPTPAPAPAPGAEPPAAPATPLATRQVTGRFSVQLPEGEFIFADEAAERNRLAATHMKAAVNGVVISIIASKAAAGELDAAVAKAVKLVTARPGLHAIADSEIQYAGHKAYKYVFSEDVEGKGTLYFSYLMRDDERVYIFTASVYATHRAEFEALFDRVAQSIKKDPAAAPAASAPAPVKENVPAP